MSNCKKIMLGKYINMRDLNARFLIDISLNNLANWSSLYQALVFLKTIIVSETSIRVEYRNINFQI